MSSAKRNKNSRKKWHLFMNKSKVQHIYSKSCGHAYKFESKNLLISCDQFENVAHIFIICIYSGIKRNFRKFTPYNKLEIYKYFHFCYVIWHKKNIQKSVSSRKQKQKQIFTDISIRSDEYTN